MTRNFEIIRQILLAVEKTPSGDPIQTLNWEGEADEAEVGEHLQLLIEAGLVEGKVVAVRPLMFVIHRLTWSGHDFIANARNDTVWKKVMAEAKEKGSSVTMTLLEKMLNRAAEKFIGLE